MDTEPLSQSLRITRDIARLLHAVEGALVHAPLLQPESAPEPGELPALHSFLDERYAALSELDAQLTADQRAVAMALHRALVQPYFLTNALVRRSVDRPLGVPGDYLLLERLIAHGPVEECNALAGMLGRYAENVGACQGHRNRVAWAQHHLRGLGDQPAVLSFACGPERTLRGLVGEGRGCSATLVDVDTRALEFAEQMLLAAAQSQATTLQVQALKMSAYEATRDPAALARLAAAGPPAGYDAVTILGQFDYLREAVVDKLTRALAGLLRPGGLLLASNAYVGDGWRAFMEYVCDWVVIHRDVDSFEGLMLRGSGLRVIECAVDASGTAVLFAGRMNGAD